MCKCSIKDCDNGVYYKKLNLCMKHYTRMLRHGDPNSQLNLIEPDPIKRFHTRYKINSLTGCWNWVGSKTIEGYGNFSTRRKQYKAHRFSWEIKFGKIPIGKLVCHSCDNPSCVNPEHLWLGTDKDNALDKVKKNRQWRPIGNKHPLYGKHHSELTRKKISESVGKAVAKGENHYNAKLSKDDVLFIRKFYQVKKENRKISDYEICHKLSIMFEGAVKENYILHIIKRRKWKSI